MYYADSFYVFEVKVASPLENDLKSRWACLKDFFKRALIFPFALLFKLYKTFLKVVGVCFAAGLVLATCGISQAAREFFVERMAVLARDLADWVLLPLALITRLVKLILALAIHPTLY